MSSSSSAPKQPDREVLEGLKEQSNKRMTEEEKLLRHLADVKQNLIGLIGDYKNETYSAFGIEEIEDDDNGKQEVVEAEELEEEPMVTIEPHPEASKIRMLDARNEYKKKLSQKLQKKKLEEGPCMCDMVKIAVVVAGVGICLYGLYKLKTYASVGAETPVIESEGLGIEQ